MTENQRQIILSDINRVNETISNLSALEGQLDYTFAIEASYGDLEYLQNLLKYGLQGVKESGKEEWGK